MTTFLRVQQKHVNEVAHDMYNPLELLKQEPCLMSASDPSVKQELCLMSVSDTSVEYLSKLESVIDHLLEVLARILLERENLTQERKRCLQVQCTILLFFFGTEMKIY